MASIVASMLASAVMQGVAKSFREIFGELAPGGQGELVMQKRLRSGPEPADDADEEAAEEAHPHGMSEKYSGVKVKVRHTHSWF